MSRRIRYGVYGAIAVALGSLLTAASTPVPVLEVSNVTRLFDLPGDQAERVAYWVPIDLDVDTMPVDVGSSAACSSDLTQWLNENGQRILFPQKLILHNSSSEAQEISFVVGLSSGSREAQPGFYLQCGSSWIDDYISQLPEGQLVWRTISVDVQTADATLASMVPGAAEPFLQRLEPGEKIGLILRFRGSGQYRGEILLQTSNSAGDSAKQALPLTFNSDSTATLEWPGMPPESSLLVHPVTDPQSGRVGLRCNEYLDKGEGTLCSASSIIGRVARLHKADQAVLNYLEMRISESTCQSLDREATDLAALWHGYFDDEVPNWRVLSSSSIGGAVADLYGLKCGAEYANAVMRESVAGHINETSSTPPTWVNCGPSGGDPTRGLLTDFGSFTVCLVHGQYSGFLTDAELGAISVDFESEPGDCRFIEDQNICDEFMIRFVNWPQRALPIRSAIETWTRAGPSFAVSILGHRIDQG